MKTKPKKRIGRRPDLLRTIDLPTGKLNPDGTPETRTVPLGKAIAEAVAQGCTYTAAAEMYDVAERVFYEWMAKGRADSEAGRESVYTHFEQGITRACARSEGALVAEIRKICREKGDARTLLDLLGRRHPTRWGKPDMRVEVTGKDGEALIPPEVAERAITEAALRLAERKAKT